MGPTFNSNQKDNGQIPAKSGTLDSEREYNVEVTSEGGYSSGLE